MFENTTNSQMVYLSIDELFPAIPTILAGNLEI